MPRTQPDPTRRINELRTDGGAVAPRREAEPSGPLPTETSLPPKAPTRPPGGISATRILVSALIATLLGVAVVLIGPLEYRNHLQVRVDPAYQGKTKLDDYRTALLNTTWHTLRNPGDDRLPAWRVEADPEDNTLAVTVITQDITAGRGMLTQLAERYSGHLQELHDEAMQNPTQGELALQRTMDALQQEMKAIKEPGQTETPPAEDGDLVRERENAFETQSELRSQFLARRQRLEEARLKLRSLENPNIVHHAAVDPDERSRALATDVEFQQDMAELRVRLVNARRELLQTWQATSPILEEILHANTELLSNSEAGQSASPSVAAITTRIMASASEYERALRRFHASWTKEFVALEEENIEPASSTIIETQELLNSLLGDFLFKASSQLAEMRNDIQTLNSDADHQASNHVVNAALTRGFHQLESAHHKLEFAASPIRTSENFRLAEAVKSAQGLRRRALNRKAAIERYLEQMAREMAAVDRENQATETRRLIEQLEAEDGGAVEKLLEVEDQVADVARRADHFLITDTTSKLLQQRVRDLTIRIDQAGQELESQRNSRTAPVLPNAVDIGQPRGETTPINLSRRVAYGWAAAATVFITLLMFPGFSRGKRRY